MPARQPRPAGSLTNPAPAWGKRPSAGRSTRVPCCLRQYEPHCPGILSASACRTRHHRSTSALDCPGAGLPPRPTLYPHLIVAGAHVVDPAAPARWLPLRRRRRHRRPSPRTIPKGRAVAPCRAPGATPPGLQHRCGRCDPFRARGFHRSPVPIAPLVVGSSNIITTIYY
jgi:hypothetical protein